MIAWNLIITAGVLTGAATTAMAAAVDWPLRPSVAAGGASSLLIVGWRVIANLGGLNTDVVPLVSIGDCGCLVAGALIPGCLGAGRSGTAMRRSLPAAVGGLVGFVVNVVIL